MLLDQYHRIATYLRIGVTDRCNLRCRYCMPSEGIDFSDRKDLMTYEEIIRLTGIFKSLGVSKIRITGGEPFVRKDIGNLLASLKNQFEDVYITTNATLLENHIYDLKSIGISGLNISIDSLDRNRFHVITRRDSFDQVLSNIYGCIDAGIPIKLNVVIMKGVNDMEIVDFLNFGKSNNVVVRFIEAMPFNQDDGNHDVHMSVDEMLESIRHQGVLPEPIQKDSISSSNLFKANDMEFGIIPAFTRSLCGMCNRIRLTPRGDFMTCLYSAQGVNLLSLLRKEQVSDDDIADVILDTVRKKRKNGFEEEALQGASIFKSMTTIGG